MIQFISELAEEVQKRLQALEMKGRCITLKVQEAEMSFIFSFINV